MKKFIFPLLLIALMYTPVNSQSITDMGNYIQLATKKPDTTLIPKAGLYIELKSAFPSLVFLNSPTNQWKLTPSDFGYATVYALKTKLEAAIFIKEEVPYVQTLQTDGLTDLYFTFASSDSLKLLALSVKPLSNNTDTVFISTSEPLNGIAAGTYALTVDDLPAGYSSLGMAPLKNIVVTIRKNAGCVVLATFKQTK